MGKCNTLRTILTNFLNHYEALETRRKTGCDDLYHSEFLSLKELTESLKKDASYATSEGEKAVNRPKNRYKDILPYDYSRVILSEYPGVPGSDYMNANYVKGSSGSSCAYIASQGPLPNTLVDFWRMIWETEVTVIVMACNEHEGGKYKCEPYWPDYGQEDQQYGNIRVQFVKWRQVCPDFLVRTFRVTCNHDGQERIVCQFHYTTWPDHGVPTTVQPILELIRLMRDVQASESRPILVHCSAGCGRTGTICSIDYVWALLRTGKLREDFSLYAIIQDMRRQRIAMVQTQEQYMLCYKAVATLFEQQLKMIDAHTYENLNVDGEPLLLKELRLNPGSQERNSSEGANSEGTQSLSDESSDSEQKSQASSNSNNQRSPAKSNSDNINHVRKLIESFSKSHKKVAVVETQPRNEEEPAIEPQSIPPHDDNPLINHNPLTFDSHRPVEKLVGKATVIRRPSIAKLKALFESSGSSGGSTESVSRRTSCALRRSQSTRETTSLSRQTQSMFEPFRSSLTSEDIESSSSQLGSRLLKSSNFINNSSTNDDEMARQISQPRNSSGESEPNDGTLTESRGTSSTNSLELDLGRELNDDNQSKPNRPPRRHQQSQFMMTDSEMRQPSYCQTNSLERSRQNPRVIHVNRPRDPHRHLTCSIPSFVHAQQQDSPFPPPPPPQDLLIQEQALQPQEESRQLSSRSTVESNPPPKPPRTYQYLTRRGKGQNNQEENDDAPTYANWTIGPTRSVRSSTLLPRSSDINGAQSRGPSHGFVPLTLPKQVRIPHDHPHPARQPEPIYEPLARRFNISAPNLAAALDYVDISLDPPSAAPTSGFSSSAVQNDIHLMPSNSMATSHHNIYETLPAMAPVAKPIPLHPPQNQPSLSNNQIHSHPQLMQMQNRVNQFPPPHYQTMHSHPSGAPHPTRIMTLRNPSNNQIIGINLNPTGFDDLMFVQRAQPVNISLPMGPSAANNMDRGLPPGCPRPGQQIQLKPFPPNMFFRKVDDSFYAGVRPKAPEYAKSHQQLSSPPNASYHNENENLYESRPGIPNYAKNPQQPPRASPANSPSQPTNENPEPSNSNRDNAVKLKSTPSSPTKDSSKSASSASSSKGDEAKTRSSKSRSSNTAQKPLPQSPKKNVNKQGGAGNGASDPQRKPQFSGFMNNFLRSIGIGSKPRSRTNQSSSQSENGTARSPPFHPPPHVSARNNDDKGYTLV